MSNGHACCILGVCCPPGSAEQRATLAKEIQKHYTHLSDEAAEACAREVLDASENFAGVARIVKAYGPA